MSSENSVELLKRAGWTPERNVDPSKDVEVLAADGYVVGQHATRLIANVTGIRVEFGTSGRPDVIEFGPRIAAPSIDPAWVGNYSAQDGTSLVPIGLSNHRHLVLLVSEDGRWFGAFDDVFGLVGQSVTQVVETISNGAGFLDR